LISTSSRSAEPAQARSKFLPLLGTLLVTGGFLLLGWLAYISLSPGPAPYNYKLVEEGGVDKFAELGLKEWPDLAVSKYEVYVQNVKKPVAVAHLVKSGENPPVLLDWESLTSELLTAVDNKSSELVTLVTAIKKHAPEDAIILSWWDTSRQIELLTGRDTLFPSHHGEPVIIPSHWRERSEAIKNYEEEFWGAPAPAEERRKLQRFADALVADVDKGSEILRELAGSREAYVVVHIADLYKLGLMRPKALDLAYKSFPMNSGNMHGLVNSVKRWKTENNYETYTLQSLNDRAVRGYFLSNGQDTMLAQMLPFTETRPLELTKIQLIYQHGGYWVYKIPSIATPAG
jgi:hydroxylamine oxidation protein HaoB